jgi:hypothetical protein
MFMRESSDVHDALTRPVGFPKMRKGETRVSPPAVHVTSFDTLKAVRAMQEEFGPFRDDVFKVPGKRLAAFWLRERATDRNLLEHIARRVYIELLRPDAATRADQELTLRQREQDAQAIAGGGGQE